MEEGLQVITQTELFQNLSHAQKKVDDWHFIKSKKITNLTFRSMHEDKFKFNNCEIDEIIISHGTETDLTLYFEDCKIDSFIIQADCKLDSIFIDNCNLNILILNSCTFNRHFFTQNTNINSATLKGEIEAKTNFFFVGNDCDVNAYSIKFLDIGCNKAKDLNIAELNVQNILLTGMLINGTISFHNVLTHNIIIHKFTNQGIVNLYGDPAYKHDFVMEIFASNLGNFNFHNYKFDEFKKICIANSYIEPLKFYNCNLLKSIDDNFEILAIKESISEQNKREMYRQLKNAYKNQGDKINETALSIMEMEAYRKSLKGNRFKNMSDRLILYFNKYTNYYGTNWYLPIAWFLILNILLFWAFLCSSNLPLCDNWAKFFEFINPAHRLDFIEIKQSLSKSSIVLDFIARLFSGVMLFQILNAFRKYSKK